ncbi:MAG: hypothetical protein ACRD3D_05450 [Terriglobia bacterium]
MNETFLDFYRCPETFGRFTIAADLGNDSGFFKFGPDVTCFGRCSPGHASASPHNGLHDLLPDVTPNHSSLGLPFDLDQTINNLRLEKYTGGAANSAKHRMVRGGYYFIRPALGVPVRKQLQKLFLRGWEKRPFPRWPVDTTVEQLFERLMGLAMKSQNTEAIPFIWFWPGGAPSCVMMTHDVETRAGAGFCAKLMDLDDAFEIRASFQIVPEERYPVSREFLAGIRQRGFEVNVQDLNHDGHLFRNQETFLARVQAINRCAAAYGARGFRSAAMYRNPAWYDAFEISYDLSIPNVAHLEPQRGGCCTVFPYFIGKILELPLTTAQDYSLFHILNDYSIELWKRQIDLIRQRHGLISFIVHPDYVIAERARKTYRAILEHLTQLRADGEAWFALPGDVDTWWRQRAAMRLTTEGGQWVIKGPGAERARIAFARREGDGLAYHISDPASAACPV